MRALIALLSVLLLGACTSLGPNSEAQALFDDKAFTPPAEPISAKRVFAVSEAMQRYLQGPAAERMSQLGLKAGLVDALYKQDQLKLEYDSETTRTAAEAFDAKAGNCLSLVIMTAAFAKELGLAVRFQRYTADPTLGRSANLQFSIDHINVTLDTRPPDPRLGQLVVDSMTVDFLPPEDLRGLRVRQVSETTVIAMFMNNRAAESLAQGQVDAAYWWAREAIRSDRRFTSAYNTLGVIYRRHGEPAAAMRAFDEALELEPNNTQALFNQADVMAEQGRVAEAAALRERLAKIDPEPAFSFFERGRAAMDAGDYATARDLFAREVARAPYYHEFHFWLALAHFHLGELPLAQRELQLARDNSTTGKDRSRYGAKLEHLRSLQSTR